jgi:hypothetical protein
MEKQNNLRHSIFYVVLVTFIILMVPFVAMQFTNEVNWSVGDFVVMGTLLFGAGLAFVLISRHTNNFVYKAAVGLAVISSLLLVWVNLAVGLIGSGPNIGNLMYIGVIGVIVIGTYLSRFTPAGMENVMFIAAFSLVLVAMIALLANMQQFPGSSVVEIILVNLFFAILFAVSGLLFRHVALNKSHAN